MAVDPALVGRPGARRRLGHGGGPARRQRRRARPRGAGPEDRLGAAGSPAARVATMATDLGTARAHAESERQLRADALAQAQTMRDSASGVSIDEEMINLTRYQRAYQASTKVLTTGRRPARRADASAGLARCSSGGLVPCESPNP